MNNEAAKKRVMNEAPKVEGGDIIVKNETQVSTTSHVEGMTISFPFAKVYYTVASWVPAEGRAKAQQGAIYLSAGKGLPAYRIADTGADAGFNGIILGAVVGWREDRPYDPRNPVHTAPRRFATKADAEKAGLRTHWLDDPNRLRPDGRPYGIPPEASEYCQLRMLVPVDLETFTSDDFRLFKIGDNAYTPVCIEFNKQSFRDMKRLLDNLEQRERIRHAKEKGYKFRLEGMVAHIFTDQAQNQTVPMLKFAKALRDGKPWEFTKEEKQDFLEFLLSTKPGEVSAEEAQEAASDDKEF